MKLVSSGVLSLSAALLAMACGGSGPIEVDAGPSCLAGEACIVSDDGRWTAVTCVDGEWQAGGTAECPSSGTACEVGGVTYASGSTGFSDPYSCNLCSCDDGHLDCTRIGCNQPCAAGTVPARVCVGCGPAGGCGVIRTGCLVPCSSDAECEEALVCDPTVGVCAVGGCI